MPYIFQLIPNGVVQFSCVPILREETADSAHMRDVAHSQSPPHLVLLFIMEVGKCQEKRERPGII